MEGVAAVNRHCAYCLRLCGSPAKLCGGCKKRAYCSKECQTADWSSKGNGQRHVKWCRRHECGEEDVEWEVVPIPNKGLGIRAKKLIPAGSKIIVEPAFSSPYAHPGIQDLGPEGETLRKKFIHNFLLIGSNLMDQKLVALRISRLNHSCQPNADTIYDETARVAILFAQKDILPGEEISICYYHPFSKFPVEQRSGLPDCSLEEELDVTRNTTLHLYGITCPTGCFCKDPAVRNLFNEAAKLYDSTILNFVRENQMEAAMEAGERLLDIHRHLNSSWVDRANSEYLLFQIAIMKSKYIPKAVEFIRSVVELYKKVCPYSERLTKKYEKLLDQPESHYNYLLIDRS